MKLSLLYTVICLAICLRVIFYRRSTSTYRPIASALAYLIVLASGAAALRTILCHGYEPGLEDIVMHAVLLMALLSSRGNVTEVFHTREAENLIYRLIRRHHA